MNNYMSTKNLLDEIEKCHLEWYKLLIILICIKDTEFVVHDFQRENSKTVVNYTTFEGT